MLNRNKESGFTIIEVVLVLAIAGLIFLIVFVALPQLQRSQRDTTRRSDAGRAAAATSEYAADNSGQHPAVVSDMVGTQIDADGWSYTDALELDGMLITSGEDCNAGVGSRAYKIETVLENGTTYCVDG